MFSCSDVTVAFFAIINNVPAITLKTVNILRTEFFRKHIFKMKMFDSVSWRFENDVNLQ